MSSKMHIRIHLKNFQRCNFEPIFDKNRVRYVRKFINFHIKLQQIQYNNVRPCTKFTLQLTLMENYQLEISSESSVVQWKVSAAFVITTRVLITYFLFFSA